MRFLGLLALCLAVEWASLSLAAALSPAEKHLLEIYISARRSGNFKAIQSLLHPESKACISNTNEDYYLARSLVEIKVPAQFEATASSVEPAAMKLQQEAFRKGGAPLPILPTSRIHLNFQPIDNRSKGCRKFQPNSRHSEVLELTNYNGQLRIVWPCANSEAVARFRDEVTRGKGDILRADSAYRSMPNDLKGQLTALIKAGEIIKAKITYATSQKVSPTEAYHVIEKLCDSI